MKEWRKENNWGGKGEGGKGREGEKVGRGGKGSAERGEEGKERMGGNERRKVGWGVLLHAVKGDRSH
jgi:hypothetical protein